jgi:hypothetical protein
MKLRTQQLKEKLVNLEARFTQNVVRATLWGTKMFQGISRKK